MIFYNKTTVFKTSLRIYSLTNQDFDYLAETIVKIFPTESACTYYIPPIPKRHSRTQKSIVSRGKLVDKYRNKMREYKNLSGSDTTCTSFSATAESSDDDSTLAYLQPC